MLHNRTLSVSVSLRIQPRKQDFCPLRTHPEGSAHPFSHCHPHSLPPLQSCLASSPSSSVLQRSHQCSRPCCSVPAAGLLSCVGGGIHHHSPQLGHVPKLGVVMATAVRARGRELASLQAPQHAERPLPHHSVRQDVAALGRKVLGMGWLGLRFPMMT